MARVRSPNRDKAFEIYKSHGGNITNREIANILNEKEKTISNWKCRDLWDEQVNCSTTKNECSTTKENSSTQSKRGAPPGNKNSVGNSGGSAPPGNKNAETHGFFSKYLPSETLEIMKEIEEKSPIDLLWDNIIIQYTAIIRAQRIMYVRDKSDITKVQKKVKGVMIDKTFQATEQEWEYQHAWDKQATFLNAQSRAMAELRNQIKDYEELCKSDMATEEQKLRIEKLKVEIDKIKQDKGNTNKEPIEITIVRKKGDEQ